MLRTVALMIVTSAMSAAPALTAPAPAAPASAARAAEKADAGEAAFRAIYRMLDETDTTPAPGDCTLAAARIADVLRAAGYAPEHLVAFAAPDHPREGGLVAIWPGRSATLKPLLLLAHSGMVEARRQDWPRDGQAQAAILVDIMAHLARDHARPRRTVKLALTCGQATSGGFNGAQWLAENRRDLIDAGFALNAGTNGKTDGRPVMADRRVVALTIEAGEKSLANFRLEARNRGGDSALPRPDNAIYQLAHALDRIEAYTFPLEFNATTRAYVRTLGAVRHDATGRAMVALAADPTDRAALWHVDSDAFLHANLRTTCVATMLNAGDAPDALAQRARATVNCRIVPGHDGADIGHVLERVIGDPDIAVTALPPLRPAPPPPPLDPAVLEPARRLVAKIWPGVLLVPAMANGDTDATFLNAAGIATYGVPWLWGDADGTGVRALEAPADMRAVQTARQFLADLIRAYAF